VIEEGIWKKGLKIESISSGDEEDSEAIEELQSFMRIKEESGENS
jgi:hypothetical protein